MKVLITVQHSPYSSHLGREALDAALLALAFEHEVQIVFLGAGVEQILSGQTPQAIGIKSADGAWRSLTAHGVEYVHVEQRSLRERGIAVQDLLLPVHSVPDDELGILLGRCDAILSF